jgi:hypothetical protein
MVDKISKGYVKNKGKSADYPKKWPTLFKIKVVTRVITRFITSYYLFKLKLGL